MKDLGVALALMLVLEGCIYAVFPLAMKKISAETARMSEQKLRLIGLGLAVAGLTFMALIKR
ncbi:MAG: DUF2065 family protein [Micavibrio sp.]|nr:DUF2065 family protein [Micavibrio sp.]